MESLLHNGTFIFWTAITLICVIPPIAHYWYKVRKAEMEAALKQDMVRQGMSAEDIERVLNAGKKNGCEQ